MLVLHGWFAVVICLAHGQQLTFFKNIFLSLTNFNRHFIEAMKANIHNEKKIKYASRLGEEKGTSHWTLTK